MQLEHLVGRVPAGEAKQLGQIAERRPGGARARAARPRPRPRPPALAHEPDKDLDERRLPGAVRPEQADELALPDLEIDASQRLDGAVPLGEAANGERRLDD